MVNQHDGPSWGHMAEFNTTFWESFDADKTKISLDHWPFSAVGEWLMSDVAGLKPDEQNPGYQSFTLYPRPSKEVAWCKAKYDSIRGQIVCNWSLDAGTFNLSITVPPNCTAIVYLPARDIKSVTEGGKPAAEAATFLRIEDDRVVLSSECRRV